MREQKRPHNFKTVVMFAMSLDQLLMRFVSDTGDTVGYGIVLRACGSNRVTRSSRCHGIATAVRWVSPSWVGFASGIVSIPGGGSQTLGSGTRFVPCLGACSSQQSIMYVLQSEAAEEAVAVQVRISRQGKVFADSKSLQSCLENSSLTSVLAAVADDTFGVRMDSQTHVGS
jgi:hypothetical protein